MKELIINKEDLLFNINKIKEMKDNENYTIIAVVKGNGYGLDIVKYTKFLAENGIDFFAVASKEEAIILREAGVTEKIINLTPYSEKNDVEELIDNDIILAVDSEASVKITNEISIAKNKKVKVHIKIDTGLSRYGFRHDEGDKIKKLIDENTNLDYEGIFSHLSNSLAEDSSFSKKQFDRFQGIINMLEEKGIKFKYKHICNSSGFFKYPEMHLNCARIGSAFTGNAYGKVGILRKIGVYHTKVARVRELKPGDCVGYGNSYVAKRTMKIAILHTGYYDGIGITLVNQRFKFLSKVKRAFNEIKNVFKDDSICLNINGYNYNVIGQIGMFDTVIDITEHELKENDDVTFNVRPVLIESSIERKYI